MKSETKKVVCNVQEANKEGQDYHQDCKCLLRHTAVPHYLMEEYTYIYQPGINVFQNNLPVCDSCHSTCFVWTCLLTWESVVVGLPHRHYIYIYIYIYI